MLDGETGPILPPCAEGRRIGKGVRHRFPERKRSLTPFPPVPLSRLLRTETVVVPLRPKDKWEAIERLVDRLVEGGALSQTLRGPVLEALVGRERSMSTGMEQGVAIPHAAVDEIQAPLAALGIVPDGVAFESIDGQPATIVVLLVIPRREKHLHIRTLAEVARLLTRDDLRESLLAAPDAAGVLQALRSAEGDPKGDSA